MQVALPWVDLYRRGLEPAQNGEDMDLVWMLIILGAWILLQAVVLPRLGVPT